jgi:hypothetical protein
MLVQVQVLSPAIVTMNRRTAEADPSAILLQSATSLVQPKQTVNACRRAVCDPPLDGPDPIAG